jgi:hypothetical protein
MSLGLWDNLEGMLRIDRRFFTRIKHWNKNQGRFLQYVVSEFFLYFYLCKIGPLFLVLEPIGSWFKNIVFWLETHVYMCMI